MAGWRLCGFFGFFFEGNKCAICFCEIIVRNQRSSSSINARDIKGAGHKAGKTEGGIFRIVILRIGRFVSLINDDKPKVFYWRKKGRAWTDNDFWGIGG